MERSTSDFRAVFVADAAVLATVGKKSCARCVACKCVAECMPLMLGSRQAVPIGALHQEYGPDPVVIGAGMLIP